MLCETCLPNCISYTRHLTTQILCDANIHHCNPMCIVFTNATEIRTVDNNTYQLLLHRQTLKQLSTAHVASQKQIFTDNSPKLVLTTTKYLAFVNRMLNTRWGWPREANYLKRLVETAKRQHFELFMNYSSNQYIKAVAPLKLKHIFTIGDGSIHMCVAAQHTRKLFLCR